MSANPAGDLTPFSERFFEELADDRRAPLRTDLPYATYQAVAEEFRTLVYQVAEMAGTEPDQLVAVSEYVHGLLDREPVRSNPVWEPQRVVLGCFLLGLTNALARLEHISAEERAALRPAYHSQAIAAVTDAFDPTFIAPEEEAMDPDTVTPPVEPDDDFSLL